jgi:DNA-directed RNA polymerase specialized sigma24 family protein
MLALRYYKNLNHNEIARILGIRAPTSRQWLKRCLDRLRKVLRADNKL